MGRGVVHEWSGTFCRPHVQGAQDVQDAQRRPQMRRLLGSLNMQRKVLLPPLVVTCFLVICALLSYRGLIAQKNAIEDIFSNRFISYQNSANLLSDMGTDPYQPVQDRGLG